MNNGRIGIWTALLRPKPLLFLVAAIFTVMAVQWSLRVGRLANDPAADDVGYLVDGLKRLDLAQQKGLSEFFNSFVVAPPHSPWSTALVIFGLALFGVNDWSPYILNGSLVLILLYAAQRYLGRTHPINQICLLSVIFLSPLALTAVHDFRPDFAVGLFTALFSLRIVWLASQERIRDKELQTYFVVGMLVGLGYLGKPTFFPHTTVICVASFCLGEISYRLFSAERIQLRPTLIRLAGLAIGVVLVAGPYFLVGWRHILDYLLANALTGANASIWKVPGGMAGSFRTYFIGSNMVRMLGLFQPLLLLWILLGLALSLLLKKPRSVFFILSGLLLSILSACIISAGQMDNPFFALPSELTFLLTGIFAIGEASRSQKIHPLAFASGVMSLIFFFLHSPTINMWAPSDDMRPDRSLNYLILKEVTNVWSANPQNVKKPTLFATFFGRVNIVSQQWLSLKHHIPINLSEIGISASLEEQLQRAQAADFVEVADPGSRWLPHLPSTLLQEAILTQLRTSSFQELHPIIGKEGTVYLFQKLSSDGLRRDTG
jgi:hypothetical protein